VVTVLQAYDWPGNIRELQTVKLNSEGTSRTLADADREHILEILKQANWLSGGEGGAANRLGLPRTFDDRRVSERVAGRVIFISARIYLDGPQPYFRSFS
jgi:transcriptional regulator with GAF, ATPase, and Fis domain